MTVTRSDGSEDIRLVSVDNAHRSQIERVLDSALTELAASTGSPQRAHQALLALLGERLLPSQTDADDLADDRTLFDEGLRSIRYG